MLLFVTLSLLVGFMVENRCMLLQKGAGIPLLAALVCIAVCDRQSSLPNNNLIVGFVVVFSQQLFCFELAQDPLRLLKPFFQWVSEYVCIFKPYYAA